MAPRKRADLRDRLCQAISPPNRTGDIRSEPYRHHAYQDRATPSEMRSWENPFARLRDADGG